MTRMFLKPSIALADEATEEEIELLTREEPVAEESKAEEEDSTFKAACSSAISLGTSLMTLRTNGELEKPPTTKM